MSLTCYSYLKLLLISKQERLVSLSLSLSLSDKFFATCTHLFARFPREQTCARTTNRGTPIIGYRVKSARESKRQIRNFSLLDKKSECFCWEDAKSKENVSPLAFTRAPLSLANRPNYLENLIRAGNRLNPIQIQLVET